jgi:hypothetical protein
MKQNEIEKFVEILNNLIEKHFCGSLIGFPSSMVRYIENLNLS